MGVHVYVYTYRNVLRTNYPKGMFYYPSVGQNLIPLYILQEVFIYSLISDTLKESNWTDMTRIHLAAGFKSIKHVLWCVHHISPCLRYRMDLLIIW